MKLNFEIKEADSLYKPLRFLASGWCFFFDHKWVKYSSGYWCRICGKKEK